MVVEDLVHDLPGHTAFLQPLFREPLLAGPGLAPELYDPDLLAADLDLFRERAPHRLMHGAERAYPRPLADPVLVGDVALPVEHRGEIREPLGQLLEHLGVVLDGRAEGTVLQAVLR